MEITVLYDLQHTMAAEYLSKFKYPWEALKGIKEMIIALGSALSEDYTEISPTVWVHKTAKIAPTAYIVWQNFVNSYQIYSYDKKQRRK